VNPSNPTAVTPAPTGGGAVGTGAAPAAPAATPLTISPFED
jgi:hypothetical protein